MVLAMSAIVLAACGDDDGDAIDTADDVEESETEESADDMSDLPEVAINIGHVVSGTEPTHMVLEQIADAVVERTDGRLTLEIFPDGQLGENRDMQEQTAAGNAQIAQLDPGYSAEAAGVDEMNVLGGPFLFDDQDDIDAVLASDLFAEWEEEMYEAGWHSLTWKFYFGERHIIGQEGFPHPDDLQGVSIRVPPNPSWIETFEALPSTPNTVEWAEVYTGLSQGVVDAAEAPLSTLEGSSLYEVADHVTLTGHFKAITGFGTSVEFWESLPSEYQDVLTEEFAVGAEEMTRITEENEEILRTRFEEELGVTLVEADIEAYAQAAEPFYDAFPTWRDGLHEQLLEIMGRP